MKTSNSLALRSLVTLAGTLLLLEQARAVEIEPTGKAVIALLRTTHAKHWTGSTRNGDAEVFYAKNGRQITAAAFIEHGLYQPNCTHTWAIGIDPRSGRVTGIRVIEMQCPHAFPTKTASFLDQYRGKGPADAAKLDSQITTVAKATGTSNLTTEAVKKAIWQYQELKNKL